MASNVMHEQPSILLLWNSYSGAGRRRIYALGTGDRSRCSVGAITSGGAGPLIGASGAGGKNAPALMAAFDRPIRRAVTERTSRAAGVGDGD
jgi:hypothetical protein